MNRPYFYSEGDPDDSGVILVFETTAQRARARGFREWPGCHDSPNGYLDCRATRAPEGFEFFRREPGPHVVEDCGTMCETWDLALASLSAGGVATDRTTAPDAENLPNPASPLPPPGAGTRL